MLAFLDASALAKRYVPEVGSDAVNVLFQFLPRQRILVLLIGVGEVLSVITRRRNAGQLSTNAYATAVSAVQAEVMAPDGILFCILLRSNLSIALSD